jgi:hypothetical protein
VEVDRTASLVLGHLRVAHPDQPLHLGLADAGQVGQGAIDGHAQGAAPQLGRQRVPQGKPRPVEAVVTQWPAEGVDLGLGVTVPAGDGAAVLALGLGIAGPARHGGAVLGAAGVDRPEGRRGEGHEQPRVGGDSLGQALAAAQPGGDQVPGVPAIGLGAGRADAGPAVAVRLEQHPVRLVLGGVGLADFAGTLVGLLHAAGQSDRVGTVGSPPNLALPAGQCRRVGRRLGQLVGSRQVGRGGGPHGPDSSRGGHARPPPLSHYCVNRVIESGITAQALWPAATS